MIRFLADEDFNNDILRGLLRHLPKLDIIRVQDIEMRNVDDSIILAWAAQENYVVLTHDVNTMVAVAFQRTQEDLPMPGVLAVQRLAPLAKAIDDIVFLAQVGQEADFRDQVRFIPL